MTREALSELDAGLLWKFANVELTSGEVYNGQIVGIYNEAKFMWNPTEFSTISIFSCADSSVPFSQFSTSPGESNSVFTLSSANILTITLVEQPVDTVEYRIYVREHGHVFSHVPVE